MRSVFLLLTALLINSKSGPQALTSGMYSDGLNLAYNPETHMVTGFFGAHTGYDNPKDVKFDCVFYLEGKLAGNQASIKVYNPGSKTSNVVKGTLKIKDNNTISIQLSNDPGGCWNIEPFSEGVDFELETPDTWKEVRYVITTKSYFYSDKTEASRRKAYIVRGDAFYVDRIEGEWLHGIYMGKAVTEGWLKAGTTNEL